MKKIFISAAFLAFYCFLEFITWICLAIDEIAFPGYKKIQVHSPLFILGMPRTASTWLHRCLCSDKNQFTSVKLWEVIFAPSVLQKKALHLLSEADRHCGRFVSSLLKKIDRFLLNDYKSIHPTSFFEVEEDDIFMMHIFSNNLLVFCFPRIRRLRNLAWFDSRLSERRKRRVMRFYRKCIQKHLYTFGDGRAYLSKSPAHTPKLRSLKETFPGCRIICIFRPPEQVIPSTCSMFSHFLKIYGNNTDLRRMTEHALQIADHWYAYPLENIIKWPVRDFLLIDYRLMVKSPGKVIPDIYNHFGFEMSDEFRQKLNTADLQNKNYKTGHHYSFSDFELDETEIKGRYDPVYQEYIRKARFPETEQPPGTSP